MPNLTCIKIFITTLALAMPAYSQSPALTGCYARDYSDAHLAKNPDQIVDKISLGFASPYNEVWGFLSVLTANQGKAKKDGLGAQTFKQILICSDTAFEKGKLICAVECDGGQMEGLQIDGKTIKFKTDYLLVGEIGGCGGAIDLAEKQDTFVTYVLHRVDDAQCDTTVPNYDEVQN